MASLVYKDIALQANTSALDFLKSAELKVKLHAHQYDFLTGVWLTETEREQREIVRELKDAGEWPT